MDLDVIRTYALGKPETSEDMPFGPGVLVLRVSGKMFLLAEIDSFPLNFNLKCDPELAVELRDRYEAVRPGYHQNKKHWNTIEVDGSIPDKEIFEMIDHSYECVVKTLKKADRERLGRT